MHDLLQHIIVPQSSGKVCGMYGGGGGGIPALWFETRPQNYFVALLQCIELVSPSQHKSLQYFMHMMHNSIMMIICMSCIQVARCDC